jgi:hypothetical protein
MRPIDSIVFLPFHDHVQTEVLIHAVEHNKCFEPSYYFNKTN